MKHFKKVSRLSDFFKKIPFFEQSSRKILNSPTLTLFHLLACCVIQGFFWEPCLSPPLQHCTTLEKLQQKSNVRKLCVLTVLERNVAAGNKGEGLVPCDQSIAN